MRAKPRPQQGPKAFHGVDVYCMKAIPVVIPCIFPSAVTDAFMRIAPLFQAAINIVLIGINTSTRRNRRLDQGLDRPLLDDAQQMTSQLRHGIVLKKSSPTLTEEVECDEVYIVAGHKGKPDEVVKKGGVAGADASRGNAAAAPSPRRSRRSSG